LIRVDKSFLMTSCNNERKKLHLSIAGNKERSSNYWTSKTVALLDLYRDDFFTLDLVDFFNLKTELNKTMVLEYTSVLKFIGEALSKNEALSWEDIGFVFWEELITFEFIYDCVENSYKRANTFFIIIMEFITWLDKKYKFQYTHYIKYIIEKNRNDLLDCIYLQNRLRKGKKPHFHEDLYTFSKKSEEKTPGLFLIENRKNEWVYTYELLTRKRLSFKMPKIFKSKVLRSGMVFHAVIGKTLDMIDNELLYLECIYPPKAVQYLKNYI
jgi:hypothetical protein